MVVVVGGAAVVVVVVGCGSGAVVVGEGTTSVVTVVDGSSAVISRVEAGDADVARRPMVNTAVPATASKGICFTAPLNAAGWHRFQFSTKFTTAEGSGHGEARRAGALARGRPHADDAALGRARHDGGDRAVIYHGEAGRRLTTELDRGGAGDPTAADGDAVTRGAGRRAEPSDDSEHLEAVGSGAGRRCHRHRPAGGSGRDSGLDGGAVLDGEGRRHAVELHGRHGSEVP